MARVRFGVVLLVPPPLDREIDGLRRACGDRYWRRVPPHITLVPPVNVRVEAIPDALRTLREAATSTRPFSLVLGPPTTFSPDSPTLYLAVGGDEASVDTLDQLRGRVFVPPLERPLDWPFVAHVTIADDIDRARLDAARAALADYEVEVRFERVHLLQEQRHGEEHRRWVPVADAPFAPLAVVGRGGVELELCRSEIVDLEADAFEQAEWAALEDAPPPDVVPRGADPLVITARHHGRVVGVARGWARDGDGEPVCIVVGAEERGRGIGRQLHLALQSAIADTSVGLSS